jgi:hypothetical protein
MTSAIGTRRTGWHDGLMPGLAGVGDSSSGSGLGGKRNALASFLDSLDGDEIQELRIVRTLLSEVIHQC